VKPFVFRFEKLLNYKKDIEDQKKAELAKWVSEFNKVTQEIERVKNLRTQILNKVQGVYTSSLNFKLNRQSLMGIQQTIVNGKKKLLEIQKKIDLAREIYIKAKQEREVFDKLKEKDQEKYKYEAKKIESKVMAEAGIRLWRDGNLKELEWT
jgi:flagellar FliJ protein